MAIPGETITRTFFLHDGTLAPVLGKVTSDFTFAGYRNGSGASMSPAVAELGGGHYSLAYTLPGTAGVVDLHMLPPSGAYIEWPALSGEVEAADLDAVLAVAVRPVVSLSAGGSPAADLTIRLIAGDYSPLQFSVVDAAGNAVDLSGYTNWRFDVQNAGQTSTANLPYSLTSGITGSAAGVVAIPIPETASMYSELTAGLAGIKLYWSLAGDEAGDATKTRTVARGVINILRREF